MRKISAQDVKIINLCVLGVELSDAKVVPIMRKFGDYSVEQYYWDICATPAALSRSIEKSMEQHLLRIHQARVKLVKTKLPAAQKILDLGGANGSIYAMGYPYKFNKITIIDLPPDERDPMYKEIKMSKMDTPNGKIDVHYGDMADLSFIPEGSIDLVWSGESIEHVPEDVGIKTFKEAYRVLKPGGYFCLDTPNGEVTRIHTGGGFIHPEHKIEYSPDHLIRLLHQCGFEIKEKFGLCEMKSTAQSGAIDYKDFVLGNQISSSTDAHYIQYYACTKPIKSRPYTRKIRNIKYSYSAKDKSNRGV